MVKKRGIVYGTETTRKGGRKEIYTGMTRRSIEVRRAEEKPRKSKR